MTRSDGYRRTLQIALAVLAVVAVVIFAVLRTTAVVVRDRGDCLWLSYEASSWYSSAKPPRLAGIGVVKPVDDGRLEYHDLAGASVVFGSSSSCE